MYVCILYLLYSVQVSSTGLLVPHASAKEKAFRPPVKKNVPGVVYGLVTRLVSWDVELSKKILRFLGYFYY